MNDLIKKEQLSGQKVVVGDKYTDLVLKTLGRVYIQTGNKLTLLNDFIQTIDKASEPSSNEDNIIIVEQTSDLNDLKYPGDGKFVFVKNSQNLYICSSGEFIPIIARNESDVDWEKLSNAFVNKKGDVMNGDLTVPNLKTGNQIIIEENELAPLVIKSKKLVSNLNANYLEGKSADEFTKRKEDERISGAWDFVTKTTFSNDVEHGGSLYSKGGFASGFSGYGWMLDSATNTLTIDNLIVRKTMNIYELVVNKINATNGSLWVTDSAKASFINPIVTISYKPNTESEELTTIYKSHQLDAEFTSMELLIQAINDFNNGQVPEEDGTKSEIILFESEELKKDSYILVADENPENHINQKRYIYNHYFTGEVYEITLDNENSKYCPFRINDIIRCQKFRSNTINYYDAVVTNINYNITTEGEQGDGTITIRLCSDPTDIKIENKEYNDKRDLGKPQLDDGLVRIGNISDENRQGAVYITSNDDKSPFIDVSSGMNRPDFSVSIPYYKKEGTPSSLKYSVPTKVRLGRIDGIKDPAFGTNQPTGMGLVAENVFLKGRFVQVDGDVEYYIPVYKGEYKPNVIYNPYNYVTFNRVAYLCIKTTDGTIDPTNKEYWNVYIEGVSGEDGASLMFSGEWDTNKEYRIRPDVRTVVTRTVDNGSGGNVTNYYQTMINSEIDLSNTEGLTPAGDGTYIINPNDHPETLIKLWKGFGGQFSSIATGLILSEQGYINLLNSNDIYITKEEGTVTAGMSGKGVNSEGIRFWAGSDENNKLTAPFKVDELGTATMDVGICNGEIKIGKDAGIWGSYKIPPGQYQEENIPVHPNNLPVFYSGIRGDGSEFTPDDAMMFIINKGKPTGKIKQGFAVTKDGRIFSNSLHGTSGSIGDFKIKNGEIIGYNSLDIPTLQITKNSIGKIEDLVQGQYESIRKFTKTEFGSIEYGNYVSTQPIFIKESLFDNYIKNRTNMKVDYNIKLDIKSNNLGHATLIYGFSKFDLINTDSAKVIETRKISNNSSGSLVFEIPEKGNYSIAFIASIDLDYIQNEESGDASFDYTVNVNSYEFTFKESTIIGSDGIVSYWGPRDYFYIKKTDRGILDIKMKGNIEILNQETKNLTVQNLSNINILSYRDINSKQYPEGTIYYDENKILRII